MKRTGTLLLCLGFAHFAFAITPNDLMDQAMHSPNGIARGTLEGKSADAMKSGTKSAGEVQVEAQRLEERDSCQYFKLTVTQEGIPVVNGNKSVTLRTETKVGTCRDKTKTPDVPIVLSCTINGAPCPPPPGARPMNTPPAIRGGEGAPATTKSTRQ